MVFIKLKSKIKIAARQGFLLWLLFSPEFLAAQQYEQTVRGVVMIKNTLEPLQGANVTVTSNDRQFGATTSEKGAFAIQKIPVGRCNISVSMLGYTPFVSNNVMVYSGRETILEIGMEEDVFALAEITITAKVDKELPLNQMAVVSARMLSSEEAGRYAGGFAGDPARLVTGFAGVVNNNDERNDIVVRGNSPAGLLWRLDGFELANPNHFGAMGASGGAIGMLNNNQLANSDFFTSAFPAEYGNAMSGVFDMHLRNGNNQKHEYMASIGMLAFEFGAEGPFSKKSNASYMINGRYSFLEAMQATGIFKEGDGMPAFQDICAKINIPLKSGNLSWVTLLGRSTSHHKPAPAEAPFELEEEIDFPITVEDFQKFGQIFTGLNYTHRFGTSTRLENRFSYQWMRDAYHFNMIEFSSREVFKDMIKQEYCEGRIAYNSTLNHRFSTKSMIKSGIGADVYLTNISRSEKDWENELDRGNAEKLITAVPYDYNQSALLLKEFIQWQYRLGKLSIIPGVYGHFYTLNNDYSIEPRIGIKWEVSSKTLFSLGGGNHSQLQRRLIQFYRDETGEMPNKNLKMSKSWQTVAGYSQKIGTGMHLKTEIYYQWLFKIPVLSGVPEESILNYAQDDEYDMGDMVFVNKGTGYNYGLEMTFEKFFDKHYYFLVTASLYDSKYKGYDHIERRTRFAGNYAFNALFGYEWKIGKRNLLSANTKAAYIGGKREVPMLSIPLEENEDMIQRIFDYTQAYKKQLPAYFRWDLNINMKTNFKRFALEWFIEVVNLTNHKNIRSRSFDTRFNRYNYKYQYSMMPVFGCKVYF